MDIEMHTLNVLYEYYCFVQKIYQYFQKYPKIHNLIKCIFLLIHHLTFDKFIKK